MTHEDDMPAAHPAYTLEQGQRAQRLDAFVQSRLEGLLSREKVKTRIKEGMVTLNGLVCDSPAARVQGGDTVELLFDLQGLQHETTVTPQEGEIAVLWHDADLCAINKPAGLSVHPGAGREDGTLVNRLLAHFPELGAQGGDRPGIVHRLDMDTTGLLLVALNEPARLKLSAAFAGRDVHKEYLALVYGVPSPCAGSVNLPIGRHPTQRTKMAVLKKGGREALTDYRVLYADPGGRFSLLAVRIHTGRTHQIRVHLLHIGHPILGDSTYFSSEAAGKALLPASEIPKTISPAQAPGPEQDNSAPSLSITPETARRQAFEALRKVASRPLLHAWKIKFPHPADGRPMCFCQSPPEDFPSAALALHTRMQRVILTGNSGCGKSSVLRYFTDSGVPVWSADEAVRILYEKNADGWHLLRSRYGSRFVPNEEQCVDKRTLFQAMQRDASVKKEVEALIHPLVYDSLNRFWSSLDAFPRKADMAVAEVPLYFESRGPRQGDAGAGQTPETVVVGVHCPDAIRLRRLRDIRGWDDAMIASMEGWQWPEDKKMRACDLVLDNGGLLEDLPEQCRVLQEELAMLRARKNVRFVKYFEGLVACPKQEG